METKQEDHEYPAVIWTTEKINRFWDWQSRFPENYFTNRNGAGIASFLKQHLGDSPKTIVDLGCGVGYLLPHLVQEFKSSEIIGADPSPASVSEANRRMRELGLEECAVSLESLNEKGLKVDVVLAIEVIEHLNDDSLDQLCQQVRDLLRPGGIAVFTTPNDENLRENEVLCPNCGELFHRWQHVRNWSADSVSRYMESAGFEVIGVFEKNFADYQNRFEPNWWKLMVKRLLSKGKRPHLACVTQLP